MSNTRRGLASFEYEFPTVVWLQFDEALQIFAYKRSVIQVVHPFLFFV